MYRNYQKKSNLIITQKYNDRMSIFDENDRWINEKMKWNKKNLREQEW